MSVRIASRPLVDVGGRRPHPAPPPRRRLPSRSRTITTVRWMAMVMRLLDGASLAGSSSDELLPPVDVEGGAGERGVGHDVHLERGDVGRLDDAVDRQGRPELLTPGVEAVAEDPCGQG